MEFNKKLQELRKQKGLTQEQLANALFVSRTAISKWESGRGYPNLDSLKSIANFFCVTVDELLSNNELLAIAEEETRQNKNHILDLVYGLLDCSVLMFFFVPFFGQKTNGILTEVSLLSLNQISPYLKTCYFVFTTLIILCGVLTLALQNYSKPLCMRNISLTLNALGLVLFIVSMQPYAAIFLFSFLTIKVLMLIKQK